MDALVERRRLVDGKPTSLADLGYTRASVDGRYIGCAPSARTECGLDCGGVAVAERVLARGGHGRVAVDDLAARRAERDGDLARAAVRGALRRLCAD